MYNPKGRALRVHYKARSRTGPNSSYYSMDQYVRSSWSGRETCRNSYSGNFKKFSIPNGV